MRCEAELCANWTGEGCACAVIGLEPALTASCEERDHPDMGDGVCLCGMVVYSDPEDGGDG